MAQNSDVYVIELTLLKNDIDPPIFGVWMTFLIYNFSVLPAISVEIRSTILLNKDKKCYPIPLWSFADRDMYNSLNNSGWLLRLPVDYFKQAKLKVIIYSSEIPSKPWTTITNLPLADTMTLPFMDYFHFPQTQMQKSMKRLERIIFEKNTNQ